MYIHVHVMLVFYHRIKTYIISNTTMHPYQNYDPQNQLKTTFKYL